MKKIRTIIYAAVLSQALAASASGLNQSGEDVIKLNQVGYYPDQEKVVVVEGNGVSSIVVCDSNGKKVLKAKRMSLTTSPISGKKRASFDLSPITKEGEYTVVAGKDKVKMTVSANALNDLAKASIKSFYYQRTAMPLTKEFAGKWSRPSGHIDNKVEIHPSAASEMRPVHTIISSSKGWYDAGDYNKYVVNSAFSMGLMLSMYDLVPDYFKNLEIDIPEKTNTTADLLDENMWNLDWLFTMQDFDGGVYHKLTTPNFESFIMPKDCKQKRYVVQKTTCATLDFAAIMAHCARTYEGNADYSGVSIRAINAARTAYEWAKQHPSVFYRQGEMNGKYEPKVNTGAYDDMNSSDEFFWASVELYLSTGEKAYLNDAYKYAPKAYNSPSWGNVSALGVFAIVNAADLKQEAKPLQEDMKRYLCKYAEEVSAVNLKTTSFYSTYGNSARDFYWGCNSEGCGVQGIGLLFAYKLTDNKDYLMNAMRNVDYMLGRNATGFCYVTGFGGKSPMHPHHRLSSADGIEEPVPGLLVGGPNPGKQDGLDYGTLPADECYLDQEPSYASNEIAINWSATLVALINGVVAMK